MKWKLSLRAKADLRRVAQRIARDNPAAAATWLTSVRERARLAGRSPKLGRMVPEIGHEDLREAIIGNYRMIYRVQAKAVVILTVFEGHRLLPELEL